MKKFMLLLLSLIMFFSVCGCGVARGGGGGSDDYDVNVNLPKDHVGNVMMLIPSGNTNETTMIDKLIEGFNSEYPNIKVEYQYVSQASYAGSIRNLYMAETQIDIIWTNTPDFTYLVSNELIYSLEPYMQAIEDALIYDFDEDFYFEAFEFSKIDEKTYVFPRSMDTVVAHVNTKIIQAAGVSDLVKDGWTWNDFIAACRAIRTYMDGVSSLKDNYVLDGSYINWTSVAYPFIRSFGADIIDENKNCAIDSTEMREALSEIRMLVEERIIPPYGGASVTNFSLGGSAFEFQSASASHYAERKELKGNYDLVSFPLIGNNPCLGAGVAGYSVTKIAQDRDAAFALMTYMLSVDGQNKMAEGGLNLSPIRKDLAQDTNAVWRAAYPTLNMDAYLFGSEYKICLDYIISRSSPDKKADLTTLTSDMIDRATNLNIEIETIIEKAVDDYNYYMGN